MLARQTETEREIEIVRKTGRSASHTVMEIANEFFNIC